ncbi:hypothetical protein MHLP_01850 [Candidatus Mycoplasma haematolamae str. Purdue]|uniref:Ig-like domain-containing protein n=1 Tax=Mycoplasma haematolamae (strain Purdue) TaxID=1212765 RepID=I7B9M5_MYCHA|nr:hypothetical protein [Candidatus Mycoplasma haematolamae]AFO51950.1 hypothetical protein MHLP_01850 [Candidatus Mycoplasma haematolamae str. Purdue]
MQLAAKAIIGALCLGGGSTAVAGASGAFTDPGRTFTFKGATNGTWTLYCPFKQGQNAKPQAEKEQQRISCLYESDNGTEKEIRLVGKNDSQKILECKQEKGLTYSCKAEGPNKTFKLERSGDPGEDYLRVTVQP